MQQLSTLPAVCRLASLLEKVSWPGKEGLYSVWNWHLCVAVQSGHRAFSDVWDLPSMEKAQIWLVQEHMLLEFSLLLKSKSRWSSAGRNCCFGGFLFKVLRRFSSSAEADLSINWQGLYNYTRETPKMQLLWEVLSLQWSVATKS